MRKLVNVKRSVASALLTLAVLWGAAAALSACNTVRGFGEDMSAAGHAITGSSERIEHGDNSGAGSSVPAQ